MAYLEGSAMRLKVDGKEIFHEAECEINASTEFKDVATKDTVGTESIPGTQSFSGSVSGVVSNDTTTDNTLNDIMTLWKNKTKVAFTYTTGTTGDPVISGDTYIESFSVGATNDETVTFSYNLKGSGELTVDVVA